ncbi:hypothetical protein BG003_007889 [Podila horticola]|nr:hypothetical protein BG003_007889 [Podila horticola]
MAYIRSMVTQNKSPIPKPTRRLEKYDASTVESGWYEWWESQGFFAPRTASVTGSSKSSNDDNKTSMSKFTMLTPPPNVTGYLHIGHALTASIQDAIIRWRRMRGESVSWVPGMDHAGISTQTVVEKKLMREKKLTRHDLGRAAFIEQIWDWKDLHGDRITGQLRRLGASMDWDQSFFTLDDTRSQAVKSAFIQLFKDGLVYRDTRLVNWCCALETVISDIEVDYEDVAGRTMLSVPGRLKKYYSENCAQGMKVPAIEFGVLHDFAYKVEGEQAQELVVSTTRIETMLGDEAVAIHPDDPRYTHLHGKHVIHPISVRRLPIICDPELVDMEFGTGVVKVTPAHDPNDYACGRRHGLPINMNRFDARDKIIEELKSLGAYRGKNEKHSMRLAKCSRSGDVIEPMVMPQWYIKCDGMAQRALKDAESGELVFHPESAVKEWNRWLENIQDWCISRQLWWGHRIPAYKPVFESSGRTELAKAFGPDLGDGPWFVADSKDEAASQIHQLMTQKGLQHLKFDVVQDDDVLDTWFSSGLLPLSSLGWTGPGRGQLPARYPTNLIETGTDIMFFWVARMVMLCSHLSGQVPFKDIMFHAMVRDAQGRKMSKSVGNVIDPTHVIEGISLKDLKATLEGGNLAQKEVKRSQAAMEKDFPHGIKASGADALRFTLVSSTQHTRQINLDLSNVASAQHFANKLWNLSSFSQTRFDDAKFLSTVGADTVVAQGLAAKRNGGFSLVERYIMSRLADTVSKVNQGMLDLEPSVATDTVRKFVIQDLCDVYVEFCKPTLFSAQEDALKKESMLMVLQTCLDASLRMLHPFMPFVTEELWQRMLPVSTSQSVSIMNSVFPADAEFASWKDEAAVKDMETALSVIQASRSLRQSHQVPMSRPLPFTLWTSDRSLLDPEGALQQSLSHLKHFTRAEGSLQWIDGSEAILGSAHEQAMSPSSAAVHVISPQLKLFTPLTALQSSDDSSSPSASSANPSKADMAKQQQEVKRLNKKLTSVRGDLEKLQTRLARAEYMERVPENVRAFDTKRQQELLAQEEHILLTLKTMNN